MEISEVIGQLYSLSSHCEYVIEHNSEWCIDDEDIKAINLAITILEREEEREAASKRSVN